MPVRACARAFRNVHARYWGDETPSVTTRAAGPGAEAQDRAAAAAARGLGASSCGAGFPSTDRWPPLCPSAASVQRPSWAAAGTVRFRRGGAFHQSAGPGAVPSRRPENPNLCSQDLEP